ncbi:MAG: hypothetical protein RIE58_03470 [Vicingaceae bacterium]
MINSAVLVKVPRAGLGNQLLVWAHALVFAKRHGLELFETKWPSFSIGPLLRRDRSKRNYSGLIKKGNGLPKRFHDHLEIIVSKSDYLGITPMPETLYVFKEIPHHERYFNLLIPERAFVINELKAKLIGRYSPLSNYAVPDIAVHIRLGDFTRSSWYKEPWDYYIRLFDHLEKRVPKKLRIHIFSDGKKQEIPLFDSYENLEFIQFGNDLTDLNAISMAPVIHTYPSSTFGLWAAFLSDAAILHVNDCRLRAGESNLGKDYRTFDDQGSPTKEFDGFLNHYASLVG